VDNAKTATSRERIISAARAEVETKGILGLRVQDVAEAAKVSVPLMYKYFGDRDGLLAEVLGDMFEEFVLESIDSAEDFFHSLANPTVEDLLTLITLPQQDWRRDRRWFRLQILAASMEIPALRKRLGLVQAIIQERMTSFMDEVQTKLANGEHPVSPAALALMIQTYSHGFVLNDLLEEEGAGVSPDEFAHLMRIMFSATMRTDS
jgi:AcrR family transcriptional regulator